MLLAGDEMQIENIQKLCDDRKIKWSMHAALRMQNRNISRADVINCIMSGEIIEDYPSDHPFPSCLVFGYSISGTILHVVVGNADDEIYIITVYYPDNIKFNDDLKTRRN